MCQSELWDGILCPCQVIPHFEIPPFIYDESNHTGGGGSGKFLGSSVDISSTEVHLNLRPQDIKAPSQEPSYLPDKAYPPWESFFFFFLLGEGEEG